ncbi:MAG: pyridine nucleotide-disulfide oxidoreductase [Holosporales bacterium]
MTAALSLGFSFSFADLYAHAGLVRVDQEFLSHLEAADAGLYQRLLAARATPETLDHKAEGDLLLALAPHLDDFIGALFNIRGEVLTLKARHTELAPLYSVKRLFVQRTALRKYKEDAAKAFDGESLKAMLEKLLNKPLTELMFAKAVAGWLDNEADHADALDTAARYAAWANAGNAPVGSILFTHPHKLDFQNLVPVETVQRDGVTMLRLPPEHWRTRHGFSLTDEGFSLEHALDQANYCIWCQHQGKDSCSKGLKDKKTETFQKSPLGVTLAGCPLEEKISEMNEAKASGHVIGALGIITVDNPMCAGTGHRICNDCMKSCIYQKQEAVNIPAVETRTLQDVLDLPWGFEVYSLLTRWNPLNIRRPLPRPDSGYKILVAGLGPSGFTLSHHLLNDGHTVVAVDGLKIEPLDPALSGVDAHGKRVPFAPIHTVRDLYEDLNERVAYGFGGVAEYGITVRWNKNYLKVIRLLLERRAAFTMMGGVRMGGTVTTESALSMGFDHVALCLGAGKPTLIDMDNKLARGVRQASDFLMALQLTGAGRADSIANLTVRLPVVVIGGGLTGVDTATEALAYYPVQVEKFLSRVEALGEHTVRAGLSAEEQELADEWLAHGRALRLEKAKPGGGNVIALLQQWGGSTLAYRRRLVDAPSYTLNHEEVHKALEEGIFFAENLTPTKVEMDEHGAACALVCKDAHAVEHRLPARTILVAAGTQPNTVLAREETFLELDGKYFKAIASDGTTVHPERSSKPSEPHVLMHKTPDGRFISFFGDLHPSFAGNVVKAMGSAKQGYPAISHVLTQQPPKAAPGLVEKVNDEWRARVEKVERLTPTIVEVSVHAPAAAKAFQPGQFYRLQNFEANARRVEGTTLAMEGLALTGASVDVEKGILSTIVLEMGGSANLCADLKPGEPVILMGPTGTPTEIPHGKTVLLAGGGLGNAVLFSIGKALRANGSKVLYFAGYKKMEDRYKVADIEAAADVVVWCSDEAPGFTPTRPQDRSFVGNIVAAMKAWNEGALGNPAITLNTVDHLIAIGSDRMMRAVAEARHAVLKGCFPHDHEAVGSINSPMQCIKTEICAQCLQRHVDPATGKETVVFSCFNQDQPLDKVDFGNLNERLKQNSVQEKVTAGWLKKLAVSK